ncbi:MAG: quinolinate synthase NadA [Oscillospiraceae bacterium]|nr:quinolinate synthase NadA [Oscillospiraceae bacterium]
MPKDLKDIQQQIIKLKDATDALVLAHYYQPLEIQDVADVVGDSFEMARRAKEAEQGTIVVCGVHFMAESAKILSPDKTVLLPAPDAGCPMADMVEPEDVLALREKHPKAAVMCYVNSSAAVKAVSDVCCTSSSAVKIAEQLEAEEIIFVPDRNLGRYVAEQVPGKQFYFHPGFCPIHDRVTREQVQKAKANYPKAVFAAHPECREEVLLEADFIGSTSQIIAFARETAAREIIIGTELGVLELLAREMPEKQIFSVGTSFVCPNMKKTSLDDLYNALAIGVHEIRLSPEEIAAAKASLDRMIALNA